MSGFFVLNNGDKKMQRYQTKDFYLAACIITSGMKMLSCERTKSFTIFNFEDTNELRNLVSDYYGMKYKVEAMSFSSNIRSLKSAIHSASNSQGSINNVNNQQ